MSPSKLGIFAHLALAASAVLIPPTITAEDLGDDKALEGLVIDPFKRSVALECPGCAFATREEKAISWEDDAGNAFLLDFDIGPNQDTFRIDNGYQLYPPHFSPDVDSFHVSQIDPTLEGALRLRVTSYVFRFNGAQTVAEDGTELLPMTLQIAAIEGVDIRPPELTINLLKDASGRLMIASFETSERSGDTANAPKECNEWPLLCKWKSIAADRIEKMKKLGKGCHKRPHGHHNPMEEGNMEGMPPHRFHSGRPHHHPHHRPHHMGHKGHGHGHHGHYRMHMFARRAFFTILIPIVIGIFAGTVTYLIGMVLGTFIAIVIAKVRGRGYQRIALEEDVEEGEVETVVEAENEKEEYAELPAYDDPPVYEDTPEKEVDESK